MNRRPDQAISSKISRAASARRSGNRLRNTASCVRTMSASAKRYRRFSSWTTKPISRRCRRHLESDADASPAAACSWEYCALRSRSRAAKYILRLPRCSAIEAAGMFPIPDQAEEAMLGVEIRRRMPGLPVARSSCRSEWPIRPKVSFPQPRPEGRATAPGGRRPPITPRTPALSREGRSLRRTRSLPKRVGRQIGRGRKSR